MDGYQLSIRKSGPELLFYAQPTAANARSKRLGVLKGGEYEFKHYARDFESLFKGTEHEQAFRKWFGLDVECKKSGHADCDPGMEQLDLFAGFDLPEVRNESDSALRSAQSGLGSAGSRKSVYTKKDIGPRENVLSAGALVAIEKAVRENGIYEDLKKHFGDSAGQVLNLASYLLVCEYGDPDCCYYDRFAQSHLLFTDLPGYAFGNGMADFIANAKEQDIDAFVKDYVAQYRGTGGRVWIGIETTTAYGSSETLEILSGEDSGASPCTIVIFDGQNRFPLAYECTSKTVINKQVLQKAAKLAEKLGFENYGYWLDRGELTHDGLRWLENGVHPYVFAMTDADSMPGLVSANMPKPISESELMQKLSERNSVRMDELFPVRVSEKSLRDCRLHFFYDTVLALIKTRKLRRTVESTMFGLNEAVGTPVAADWWTKEFFNLETDEDGCLVSFSVRQDMYEEAVAASGQEYFITSEEMSEEDLRSLCKPREYGRSLIIPDKRIYIQQDRRCDSTRMEMVCDFCRFIATIIRQHLTETMNSKIGSSRYADKGYMVIDFLDKLDPVRVMRKERDPAEYWKNGAFAAEEIESLGILGVSTKEAAGLLSDITLDYSKNPAEVPPRRRPGR